MSSAHGSTPAVVTPPSREAVRRSLTYSTRDGVCASVMSGVGDTYLGAFAIFLHASNSQIAFLTAVPQLLGAWFQFVSVRALHQWQRRKPLIIAGVLGQALTWLLIIATPFAFDQGGVWWLLLGATCYHLLGNFAAPPWNSLMGDLVHPNQRGRYFGQRNRAMSVAAFAALCLGGVLLHRAEQRGAVVAGFVLVFVIALAARLLSAYYLSRMVEPPYVSTHEDRFSLWQFLRDGRRTNFGRFVGYVGSMHFAVQVSGPMIAPYLLRDLRFTYLEFMLATAAVVVAQFLTLPWWGRVCDRFGNRRVLTVTGLLLPVIPVFWLFTTSVSGIVAVQMFAGASWAGFALAMGNFLFDNVKPAKRPQCVAVYSAANAGGVFLGASLAGLLVLKLPDAISVGSLHIPLVSNLQLLFLLSAVLRLGVSLKFLPMIREARAVAPFDVAEASPRFLVMGWQAGARVVGTLGRAVTVVILVVVGQRR
ncbi:MAG: MFS transporter [Nitrospirota bacterium]